MKKTPPQQLLFVLTCMATGALTVTGWLCSIADAYNHITLKLAIYITIPVLITGIIIFILFKYRKISWAGPSGRLFKIVKFGNPLLLFFAGAFLLIWPMALYKEFNPSDDVLAARKRMEPVFSLTNKRFKVLILPWGKQCEYQGKKSEIATVIKSRFDNISSQGENIDAYYLTDSIDYRNFTHQMADSIMRHHHADQILYGAYSYKECEGGTSDKICFNYITNFKDWHLVRIPAQTNYKMHDMEGLKDLREGTSAAPMDYIISWVAGVADIKQRNFSAAIQKFRQIKDFDKNEQILFLLSACYFFINDNINAGIYCEKVLKINPGNIEAAIHLGVALTRQDKYVEAKPYFEKALAYCPDDVEALLNMGRLHYILKDTSTGNQYYNRILQKLTPDTETNLAILGNVYRDMKIYAKARDCFEKSLRIHAAHADIWVLLADVCLRLKDTVAAKTHLEHATRVDSTYAEAWYHLGDVCRKMKDYKKAQVYLERALQINPVYVNALHSLGLMYYQERNYAKAQKNMEAALAINPNNVLVLLSAAFFYKNITNYNKAAEHFQSLLKFFPNDSNLWNELGMAYEMHGKYEQAFDCFKHSLRADAGNGSAYYNLASMSGCMHNKTDALKYLSKAIEKNPTLKQYVRQDPGFDWLLKNKQLLAIIQ
ncbi:tetratricopeptide repeat protein [Chitinophaga sp. GbtcB8]|uniref:tetratricopeptide repeat protein n=1 Tax=Chitinophaga sp. GbtcB8 TaxID=2824753 RepID=UPI001C2F3596|nr:tetratricopeptide repeat protein [Chitinophaga sp. GbtcB8]